MKMELPLLNLSRSCFLNPPKGGVHEAVSKLTDFEVGRESRTDPPSLEGGSEPRILLNFLTGDPPKGGVSG